MRPTVQLGEICDILDSKRKPITQKDRTKGIYPYYGASGVLDYVADYIFDEDLVLIGEDGAKRGALDNSAFKVSGKVWVNNHAHVIRPHREKIIDDFLVYFLVASDLSDYITGTTVPKLNQERLRSIEIPLPPLETQKAIVAKLDQIFAELDQTKSEIQKNLDNADELWKSSLNQAFQGDWEMKKLGDCVYSVGSGRSKERSEKGEYPIYGSTGIISRTDNFVYDKKQILIARVGANAGYIHIAEGKYDVSDNTLIVDLKENLNLGYFYYLLTSMNLNQYTNGGGQPLITATQVKNLEIPVPPLSEQEKIVEHLDQVSKEVKALKSQYQSQLDNLEELKKSVLDKAFKGEMGE